MRKGANNHCLMFASSSDRHSPMKAKCGIMNAAMGENMKMVIGVLAVLLSLSHQLMTYGGLEWSDLDGIAYPEDEECGDDDDLALASDSILKIFLGQKTA